METSQINYLPIASGWKPWHRLPGLFAMHTWACRRSRSRPKRSLGRSAWLGPRVSLETSKARTSGCIRLWRRHTRNFRKPETNCSVNTKLPSKCVTENSPQKLLVARDRETFGQWSLVGRTLTRRRTWVRLCYTWFGIILMALKSNLWSVLPSVIDLWRKVYWT